MLNEGQRSRIINDVANWKSEYEMGTDFSSEQLQEYVDELKELSDEELKKWWASTVGEWVAHRADCDHPDEELEKLLNGEETGYGYLNPVKGFA